MLLLLAGIKDPRVLEEKLTPCQYGHFSICLLSGMSVNDRVIEEKLTPCQYSHCLLHMLHYIAASRLWFPQVRILVGKYDWRNAY